MPSKKIRLYLLSLIATTSTLVICELALRILCFYPSFVFKSEGFGPVDSLILYENFTTDETGIYKFSKLLTDSMPKYINTISGKIENDQLDGKLYNIDQWDYIFQSYRRLIDTNSFNSMFWKGSRWYNNDDEHSSVAQVYAEALKDVANQDGWNVAIREYINRPFNSEGFRSIPFRAYKTNKKKILIVGDSFLYGMSAKPFYNSFYDILLSRGYLVYNAGIPGTDPAQYWAIIRKYLTEIKPDLVIVCFYPGNDIMSYPRTPKAQEPHEHITNAGFFSSNINGQYYDAERAYKYYLSLSTIRDSSSFIGTLLLKSSIGTLVWKALHPSRLKEYIDAYNVQFYPKKSEEITSYYTKDWTLYCDSLCIPLLNIIVPDYNTLQDVSTGIVKCDSAMLIHLFDKRWSFPDNFEKPADFPKGDYHFNNYGHLKFANYLEGLIISTNTVNK